MAFIRSVLALVFLGLLVFNPLTLGVVGGIVAGQSFQNKGRDAVRAQVYPTSCATYKEATKWERWTTYGHWQMGWCEEYLDRM
ncbi:hypothetical protein G8E10_24830 [Rhizobiaceae bacterium CRRU44]|uniref:Uncharacterized protein n=1 Tax=Ferranicluibacter rubi TaxID=2715133 RepID=A0AA43ZJ87_9HYPH|nr:hypothetical protein [Ferranicluibacter rubi]NHT78928.1 hypothetical protein [Ferranicluibacter rubi]